jgi:cell wall-associated NlpC family hydrolase
MAKVILIACYTWEVKHMRKSKAMKAAVCAMSAALFLSIPVTIAHADHLVPAEQGIAGIAVSLENKSAQEIENAYKATVVQILNTEVKSPYEDLGVSVADNYVNVRSKPSTDSEVVGKLYKGCAADILERLEGDWVKIKSGDVEGYIASNFLAIGEAAEVMVDEYATKWATVNTQTLRVREKQSTDSKILTLIPQGETYVVVKEHDEWVELLLGSDDDTGNDFTGFVSKDLIDIKVEFKYAISVEEENRIRLEQEEAERAEAERKTKLAQEKAEKKEKDRKAAEAKNEQKESSNDNSTNSSQTPISNASGSKLLNEITSYAQKFVGNSYQWGGESLTRGADCSGFVRAVYADFGYSLPRVSRDQASSGKRVSLDELLPGDLLFYTNSGGSVNHVAMYIGNGMIVHAANSRQGIIRSQYNYRDIYCARRIIY